jgi:hypothetical protein
MCCKRGRKFDMVTHRGGYVESLGRNAGVM